MCRDQQSVDFKKIGAHVQNLESCLALRYEALAMREIKSAERFHAVAVKACENALRCIGNDDVQKLGRDAFPENLKATTITEITRLRNFAMTSITSHSVDKLKRNLEWKLRLVMWGTRTWLDFWVFALEALTCNHTILVYILWVLLTSAPGYSLSIPFKETFHSKN
ncbi:unnamed protein product [Trifolium pratense]|uniref:Uncharacterized protein n=1 Tax=Trifolium pratense TaxID=57577 RepID=A0ACB0IMX3_TRIPR|nr:unnamed protein product [Trifolium pratense]